MNSNKKIVLSIQMKNHKTVQLRLDTARQSELRSHTQFFYFCLKGIPAIIIPTIKFVPKQSLHYLNLKEISTEIGLNNLKPGLMLGFFD